MWTSWLPSEAAPLLLMEPRLKDNEEDISAEGKRKAGLPSSPPTYTEVNRTRLEEKSNCNQIGDGRQVTRRKGERSRRQHPAGVQGRGDRGGRCTRVPALVLQTDGRTEEPPSRNTWKPEAAPHTHAETLLKWKGQRKKIQQAKGRRKMVCQGHSVQGRGEAF